MNSLGRLAFKYARLLELRHARAAGEPIPERPIFRELAREFPGALYELDTLPLDALEARVAATQNAAEGGAVEVWMEWMSRYHALFRAALYVKARAGRATLDDERTESFARGASDKTGVAVDAAFAKAAARPPNGRIQLVVLERLAAETGETAARVKKALFPQSRR